MRQTFVSCLVGNEYRLALAAVGFIVLAFALSLLVPGEDAGCTDVCTKLRAADYLRFKNLRSADYDRLELDGMTVFQPEDRDPSGWWQIVVDWRHDQAFIVWETPPGGTHVVQPRPDGLGLWDPDTAHLEPQWKMARTCSVQQEDPPYVLVDYFTLVRAEGNIP